MLQLIVYHCVCEWPCFLEHILRSESQSIKKPFWSPGKVLGLLEMLLIRERLPASPDPGSEATSPLRDNG